jgi:hypothetical protein
MSIRPSLDDYISFFEAQPSEIHDDGWYYGVRFSVSRGDDDLIITVAPDNLEFGIDWRQKGYRCLTLNLKMVAGWEIVKSGMDEFLILRVNTGPDALCSFDSCIIRLKPKINVELHMAWGPGWSPSFNSTLHTNAPESGAQVS